MNNKPYGIMFHHFYNEKHPAGQGAISGEQLKAIIEYIGPQNILSAKEWLDRAEKGTLREGHICLTFDDALLCQYEIVLPILEDHNLTAMWFVYTSVISGGIEMLEVYRKFRTVKFTNIEAFYKEFFDFLKKTVYRKLTEETLQSFVPGEYLVDFPFYTPNDKKFRFLRDRVLGSECYHKVMGLMLKNYGINLKDFSSDLWMREDHLKKLKSSGHTIGSHSHTHPTMMVDLSPEEQRAEYEKSRSILRNILGETPRAMSHPCNSYSQITLKILTDLEFTVGFRANMKEQKLSMLEFPREDHANIMRLIEK